MYITCGITYFLKAHNHLFWPIFLSTTFYDLKVIFWYIGESPENFMSKYTLCQNIHRKYEYFENKHCIFWSKHGCFTASLDILNTKRLISPEREGFRGSNFDRFILG